MQPDLWVTDLKNWSCEYLYEYSDWANVSWYGNFNWQDEFIGEDQDRYLGANRKWVDRAFDTNKESFLKIRSPGWDNWLGDQMNRAVKSGVGYMEFDNADHALERDRAVVMETYTKAIGLGLKPILKNPNAFDIQEFAKLDVAGCIFERGTLSPVEFANARRGVNPTLQGSWVRFGGDKRGRDIPYISRQIVDVPGTSVQWGPKEYNGMEILVSNVLDKPKE